MFGLQLNRKSNIFFIDMKTFKNDEIKFSITKILYLILI